MNLSAAPRAFYRWLRAVAVNIRGKILLAFCLLAAITAFLGFYAANSVGQSGRLGGLRCLGGAPRMGRRRSQYSNRKGIAIGSASGRHRSESSPL